MLCGSLQAAIAKDLKKQRVIDLLRMQFCYDLALTMAIAE